MHVSQSDLEAFVKIDKRRSGKTKPILFNNIFDFPVRVNIEASYKSFSHFHIEFRLRSFRLVVGSDRIISVANLGL